MDNIFFPKEFYDYKEGFANGIIDFIINCNNGIDLSKELEYSSFWDLGYLDALNYYTSEINNSHTNQINFTNVLNIMTELYIRRAGQFNEIIEDKIPAFTLILTPKKENN